MKRIGRLFERILERENFRLAVVKAAKGKRGRAEVLRFLEDVDHNIDRLVVDVREQRYCVGRAHQFVVHDPKDRVITAPCFPDRVLHHAIMNVCEPLFERWLIADTYACRRGRGRDRAVLRASQFSQRFPYFLKLDVRKYFDSIDHDVLRDRLSRIFKDRLLLNLFGKILEGFRGNLRRGLPIGSLTSQHFANFYIGWLDRFLKESLRVKGYVRYMDDLILWDTSVESLLDRLALATEFLESQLHLAWKPTPYINRTRHGVDFLGVRVFPSHVTLNRRSKIRYQRRVRALLALWTHGQMEDGEVQKRLTSATAFTKAAGAASWRFRSRCLSSLEEDDPKARTASTEGGVGTTPQ